MTDSIATTRWTGGLDSGQGKVSLETSGADGFTVSFPPRTGEATGQTTPEELMAAAHAACLAMSFTGLLAREDLDAQETAVTATVSLGKVPDGTCITGITLHLQARVDGIDDDRFHVLAAKAEKTCPVSMALSATEISFSATRL